MAKPDAEALEYVDTFAANGLAWIAQAVLERIAELPDSPRATPRQIVEDADRQLAEIREAALDLVKREIDWTAALEDLRFHFLLQEVAAELPAGGTTPLTGANRRVALKNFAETLARELEESHTAVRRREGIAE